MTVVLDLYGRKSSADHGKSVDGQLAELKDDIDENGWTLGRVFVDDNRSASRFARKKREDYAELTAHIRAGRCQVLGLWESSRGSRRLTEWSEFLDLCAERGVLIYVVTHKRTYDVRNARDWKTLAEDGVAAHAESNLISERSRRGKRRAAAAGLPAGKLQFGFRRVYTAAGEFIEQVEDPEQAAIVREAAQRVLAGEAANAIAEDFNARGISSPRATQWMIRAARNREQAETALDEAQRDGLEADAERWETEAAALRWDLTQVKRLCVMPSYAGLRQHQGQVVGKATWDGIHDAETYAKLLARLNDPKRRTQRDSALRHVLSGLLRCGVCGSVMRVLVNRGKYASYVCKDGAHVTVRTTAVEPFVEEMVLARLERGDAAKLFARPERDADVDKAAAEVAELDGELAEWKALAKARKVSPASFAEIEADLLVKLEGARRRSDVAPIVVPEPILALIGAPRERWGPLTIYQRREAIGLLVDELLVARVGKGKRIFDPNRLGASRWTNDPRTWADHQTTVSPAPLPGQTQDG